MGTLWRKAFIPLSALSNPLNLLSLVCVRFVDDLSYLLDHVINVYVSLAFSKMVILLISYCITEENAPNRRITYTEDLTTVSVGIG